MLLKSLDDLCTIFLHHDAPFYARAFIILTVVLFPSLIVHSSLN